MYPPLDYFEHSRVCTIKQSKREARFDTLPDTYKGPLTSQQRYILNAPIASLVSQVQDGSLSPIDIIRTYGKTAAVAQKRTNAVTEVMIPEAEAWARTDVDLKGPLAGIPVSLKDSIAVGGFDSSVGYSRYCFKPHAEDGVMVKLLKKAGAIPHVKTALPITLLSFESSNSLWGVCRNPHNPKYSPGGSSGGEGAILAMNGSRIGIGSDVAGSVRAPAAWSGTYSLKTSTQRWVKVGINTSMPGQEGIQSTFSPMARTVDDLIYFTKSFIGMAPWEVDYSVVPIPWRDEIFTSTLENKRLRIALMISDGVCPASPAILRGLNLTAAALRKAGHQVIDLPPEALPSTATPALGLQIASILLTADGGKTYMSHFHTGETNDPGAARMYLFHSLPRPIRYLWYLWTKYIRRDSLWASLLRYFSPKSAFEQWQWVARRESFREAWFNWWNSSEHGYDFILCPANATPALPHGAMRDAVSSCGYTFLFNLLDYSAGVIPVTKVDPVKDRLHPSWRPANGVQSGAYKHYDSVEMEGLPVAVQIVGRRFSEEKTLACMLIVDQALKNDGVVYEQLNVEDFMD